MRAVLFFLSFFFLAHFSFASSEQNSQENNQEQVATSSDSTSSEDESYIQSLMAKINSLVAEVKSYFRNRGSSDNVNSQPPVTETMSFNSQPEHLSIEPVNLISRPPEFAERPSPMGQSPADLVSWPVKPKPVDKKAMAMSYCFNSVKGVLNERHRKNLLSQGVPSEYIVCPKSNYSASSSIWWTKYPTEGSCYDSRGPRSMSASGFSQLPELSDHEKGVNLEQCNQHLAKLKAGKNPDPPAVARPAPLPLEPVDKKAMAMSYCLSDIKKVLNNKKKEELISQGTTPEDIVCLWGHWPANSSVWQSEYPTASCHDNSKASSLLNHAKLKSLLPNLTEQEKDAKLKKCHQYLASLKKPVPDSLTWDDCIKNRMEEEQKSMKAQLMETTEATPESISCSGNYGSDKGWTVTCKSTNPKILAAVGSPYQPYPENCKSLPGVVNGRVAGGSSSSGQR